jgi:hypothetical protein
MRTFEQQCEIEPRLRGLFHQIPKIISAGEFWRQWVWIKRELSKLVGWTAENPTLRTEADYEIAYAALFDEASRQPK